MYDLLPLTEEERVARRILLEERPTLVLHVTDAKNLERMLPMTLELIEAGLPVALAVNLMDEAEGQGMSLDLEALEGRLGIPVVGTVSTSGRGLGRLREILAAYVQPDAQLRCCH
jgi:ferrous iron transport protein B